MSSSDVEEDLCFLLVLISNLKNIQMQFDQDCITYTQEGRLLQLEYAAKAVESAEYSLLQSEPSSALSAKTE
jgi:hypothetical protein